MTARKAKAGPEPDFFGPFVQGPSGARFFYLCVGHFAEGDEPYWFGRVKVPLSGIGWAAVVAASKDTDTRLQARYAATRPDGRPALATVALLDEGWAVFDH